MGRQVRRARPANGHCDWCRRTYPFKDLIQVDEPGAGGRLCVGCHYRLSRWWARTAF